MPSIFSRIPKALSKTRSLLSQGLTRLFGKGIDQCSIEELEALLYKADLGYGFVESCIEALSKTYKPSAETILSLVTDRAMNSLPPTYSPSIDSSGITLFVGCNGTGKTTSIAKLAHWCKSNDKEVVMVAGDTFRAAAQEQLEVHAGSIGAEVVMGEHKQDPSSVLYQALQKHPSSHLLVDTAGRLEDKVNLLEELKKMHRICLKLRPNAKIEVLFIVDATCGQHAVEQLDAFHQTVGISGLVITKLDTSSRGGVLIPLYESFKVPVHWIGTGESLEDWEPYQKDHFCQGLFPS